jgi:hypothetical protein
VRPRGIRAGLTALLLAAGLATTSACGIIGNPLADKKGEPSTAASASAAPSASPQAEPVELAAGQCFDDYYTELLARTSVHLVDCAGQHFGETVYVGRFVGAAASGLAPQLSASASAADAAAQNAAYLDCSSHADKYLGHSWIHRLLTLRVAVPLAPSWEAGERWYRCDLFQTSSGTGLRASIVTRTGSLKTSWPGVVCLNQNLDNSPIVDCKVKHPGEFVGGYLLPAGLKKEPETQKETDPYANKCWKVMAPYLGVPTSRAQYLVGVSFDYEYDFDYWASGRRVLWCYTWTGKKTSSYVTGSAKGRKGKGL